MILSRHVADRQCQEEAESDLPSLRNVFKDVSFDCDDKRRISMTRWLRVR